MPKKIQDASYKRLTLIDRMRIQAGLDAGETPYAISKVVGKSPSTITREIQRHAVHSDKPDMGAVDCLDFKSCTRRGVCGKATPCRGLCKAVCKGKCMKKCQDYNPVPCDRREVLPGAVCNSCRYISSMKCHWRKTTYKANEAHKEAVKVLTDTRSGFAVSDEELQILDRLISPRIKSGQSPYHVAKSLVESGEIDISLSTIYRMIEDGMLDAKNIDLKEKVRRRERKRPRPKGNEDPYLPIRKLGHLYEEYLEFRKEYDGIVVQMDCVEGKKDEAPALLTLHYPQQKLQLAFWMPEQTSKEVVDTFDVLEKTLGAELFTQMFPVILTDNGHEFSDIAGMERSVIDPSKKRTRIFFCEPNRSDEKGACENNHKLIRNVLPKGSSLLPYRQIQISKMMNHINSQRRNSLFGKSPMDIAMAIFPEDFFILLGQERIPDEEVMLSPKLLRS